MINLQPSEVILTGSWVYQDKKMSEDAICGRIKWLIEYELQKIKDSPQWGAWETLYQDTKDGRYWERTYPQGNLHGGGPPQLKCLPEAEAKRKYDLL